jgi:hypothetical protein
MKQKFSKDIIADEDAYYMSCPEKVAEHLAKQLQPLYWPRLLPFFPRFPSSPF